MNGQKELIKYLSERLTKEFGKGFTERNLRAMQQFYDTFPIWHTLCAELTWSHYRLPLSCCHLCFLRKQLHISIYFMRTICVLDLLKISRTIEIQKPIRFMEKKHRRLSRWQNS
ncbi:MAG: DUF1016 N-terminal domain-containing protein [Methanomicrobiales archaeon]|nr:DUF1016 N-terminal domain-containing protein [Methanomicrobiales archaeon]